MLHASPPATVFARCEVLMGAIVKIDRAFSKVEEVLLALLLVGMVLLTALQVLLRNIWNTGIDWADIGSQHATLLLGLLGAAVATSEGRHLNIDLVSRLAHGRGRFFVRVLIGGFGVAICVYLVVGGWTNYRVTYEPWLRNLNEGLGAGTALWDQLKQGEFPQWFTLLMLPLGFGLIGFHFVLRTLLDLSSLVSGKEWESQENKQLEGDALLDDLVAKAERNSK
jgi:TRAP-type C4-dicarboxylate transport system permease small subunit